MANTTILTDSVVAAPVATTPATTLPQSVRDTLQQYFNKLECASAANVYEWVLAEMEIPLLEMILQHTGQNQKRAAKALGISRTTLRKKMYQYGMLMQGRTSTGVSPWHHVDLKVEHKLRLP